MVIELLSSVREWGPYALASSFVVGVLLGNIVRSLKVRLWLIFGLILAPPIAIAALYWLTSPSHCAGVNCSNILYALLYTGGFAIFPVCLGLGTLIGSMMAGIRRAIDAWVTPRTVHANGAQ